MDENGNPKASVIVVGYNGRKYLIDCFSSVLDQDMSPDEYEVLFVDNHSADDSVRLVEDLFPSVRVIPFGENHGFYMACNKAIEFARGRYLVVVPQDTIAHRRWLRELVRAAEDDENAMICLANSVAPTSSDYEPQDRVGMVSHIHFPRISRFGYVQPRVELFADKKMWTLACAGVSGLFKRDVITETGYLFEPLVGHYIGDMEVGLRVSVLGYKIIFVPTAIIYHVGEKAKSLTDSSLLFRYAQGSRDRILAYYKNMTNLEFLLFVPLVTLGLSLKSLELRIRPIQRIALLFASLVLSPIVLAMAIFRLSDFASARKRVLSKRRVDPLWLVRNIWNGGQDLQPAASRSVHERQ